MTVLSLVSCSNKVQLQEKGKAILNAKIVDINETSLLVANVAKDASSSDIYQVNIENTHIKDADGSDAGIADLKPGMLIDIAFDGTIMESFPMRLGTISSVSIKSKGEDIAGLYKKVIDDLYAVDPGLNYNISILAFDFTKVTNLTETEKAALIYLIGNSYKMEAFASTYDELCEQGYIDKDKMYFEKGLLITIEDTAISNKNFMFNASKWRSGLGAYFFNDCTAAESGDSWIYTIGAEMIS